MQDVNTLQLNYTDYSLATANLAVQILMHITYMYRLMNCNLTLNFYLNLQTVMYKIALKLILQSMGKRNVQ